MDAMAELLANDDVVTVSLSAVERAEALHGDVPVPRAVVVSARIVPDGMDEVHVLWLPGTGFPGVIMVGTWRDEERVTFRRLLRPSARCGCRADWPAL
jgi:hypothetical protein